MSSASQTKRSAPFWSEPRGSCMGAMEQESEAGDLAPPVKRLRGGGAPMENYYPEPEDDHLEEEIMPTEEEEYESMGDEEGKSSVFSDITESTRQRWYRPANQVLNNKEDVSLQWFDMDMIGGQALSEHPSELVQNRSRVVGASQGEVPIIRAYGVTDAGNSLAVFIHGFTPYGYFALPKDADFEHTEDNLGKIRAALNNRLEGAARGSKLTEYCRAVSYVTSHKSIMGYETSDTKFLKVMVAMPTLIPTLKRIMEDGIDLAGVSTSETNQYSAFECNVPFVLRYMIDREISGAGWLTMPAKTYQIRKPAAKKTHCQVSHLLTQSSFQSHESIKQV